MKKSLVAALCSLLGFYSVNAQSKVFKEVSDEISSEMKVITQDDALVGYLLFTQLEKASEDSFNYRLTIMDENLNDIGKVNFREEKLDLQAVSFDQDILCLAYLKSNIIGTRFKNTTAYKSAARNAKNAVFTQFLNLDGKIIKTNSTDVDIKIVQSLIYYSKSVNAYGKLKHSVQLKNIPQKGFACFYADDESNNLLAFSLTGNQLWKKNIPAAKGFSLLTSTESIYLLTKKDDEMVEGGYVVLGYSIADGKAHDKYILEDKKGNALKVLAFENDVNTGKPYISGNILNPKNNYYFVSGKGISKGAYSGVFTINLNVPDKKDIKEVYSYWEDGSLQPAISRKGLFAENGAYPMFYRSIKDYQGNTYFIGSSIIKKPRWGNIASSVILSPLIVVSPILLGAKGTQKCKIKDAMLIKQNAAGALSFDNSIAANNSKFFLTRIPLSLIEKRNFYTVSNSNTKSNYLIVDDAKDIIIYNISQKKVMRTVSHKDGKLRTDIFPAKEGHIMVREYNNKEKYTRLSIESL